MKLIIDTESGEIVEESTAGKHTFALYSKESFEAISRIWLKVGWNQKFVYTFSWMGRPIIQLPEDMVRIQEVIYRVQPDVIIETGVAHGGSLVFYASLCKAMDRGRVVGVDVEIRAPNRRAIEEHALFPLITLIEGNSVAPEIVSEVRSQIKPGETALVILDSNHSKQHVLAEMEAYHEMVTPGSYLVVTDGIMIDLDDVPRGNPDWSWDNPVSAVDSFAKEHQEFVVESPSWPFNESQLSEEVTHWPSAWLRKLAVD